MRDAPQFPFLLPAREGRLSGSPVQVRANATAPVYPRACLPGVVAVVCPNVKNGTVADVKTGQNADILFRS